MNLRWLAATDVEVATAMAALHRETRPGWVPNKRQVLVHLNHCLLLWYLCIVLLVLGIRVDSYQDGEVTSSNVPGIVVGSLVFMAWAIGSVWLRRWAARPPTRRARVHQWRQDLTALANGFEPAPTSVASFSSLLGAAGHPVRVFPRFVAPGVEFGNLTPSGPRSREWRYLTVTLTAPLPHLILDATTNDGITSDLPEGIDREQRLFVGGEFDKWFRAYSPSGYGGDALYVLTPDVMADLIDHAHGYNVEFVDHSIVFFSQPGADYTDTEVWQSITSLLTTVVPRIATKAGRYLDARVPGQETSRLIERIHAEREAPGLTYIPPEPCIGADGRRLVMRDTYNALRWALGAIGWFTLLTLQYAVPGIFAFAGFMSVIDGR